jgi:hypothetical protein
MGWIVRPTRAPARSPHSTAHHNTTTTHYRTTHHHHHPTHTTHTSQNPNTKTPHPTPPPTDAHPPPQTKHKQQDLKQYLDEEEDGRREMPTLRGVKRAGYHRLYSEVQRNGGRKLVAARIGLPLKPGSESIMGKRGGGGRLLFFFLVGWVGGWGGGDWG